MVKLWRHFLNPILGPVGGQLRPPAGPLAGSGGLNKLWAQDECSWVLALILCGPEQIAQSLCVFPHLLSDMVGLCKLKFLSSSNVHDSGDSI